MSVLLPCSEGGDMEQGRRRAGNHFGLQGSCGFFIISEIRDETCVRFKSVFTAHGTN